MNKNAIFLIIGIILFIIGGYFNTRYEDNSLTVTAVVTEIKTTDETDDGPVTYRHKVYGDYTVAGREYTDKLLATKYTGSRNPSVSVGETIDIKVNPQDPAKKMYDGGIFIVAGLVLIVYNIYALIKNRKSKKQAER